MKINSSVMIVTVFCAACTALVSSPSSQTSTPISTAQTETSMPSLPSTATVFVDPLQVSTPINTPHAIPSPLSIVTQQEAFRLYDERVKDFQGSLQFEIRILGVNIHALSDKTKKLYIVKAEGILSNNSTNPIVVRNDLRTGFTVEPEVHWGISYKGKALEYANCCIDGWYTVSQDDYVLLQPKEFQKYLWAFSVPLKLQNSDGQEIILSGKPITIVAYYGNLLVGFDLQDHEGHLITGTDENGDTIIYVVDMNAWVGGMESNTVEYLFP